MAKSYLICKDISGVCAKSQPVLSFTDGIRIIIDEDTPSQYHIVGENEKPYLMRLSYISNGYISYGNESGCMAWVKVKDKGTDVGYKKIALSPEFVILEGGNEIQIYGARVFDQDFSVQIETFKLQIN